MEQTGKQKVGGWCKLQPIVLDEASLICFNVQTIYGRRLFTAQVRHAALRVADGCMSGRINATFDTRIYLNQSAHSPHILRHHRPLVAK